MANAPPTTGGAFFVGRFVKSPYAGNKMIGFELQKQSKKNKPDRVLVSVACV